MASGILAPRARMRIPDRRLLRVGGAHQYIQSNDQWKTRSKVADLPAEFIQLPHCVTLAHAIDLR